MICAVLFISHFSPHRLSKPPSTRPPLSAGAALCLRLCPCRAAFLGEAQNALAKPAHSKQLEPMSKVAQIEAELETLSQAELREIRGLLDDLIEDELEFTPEFESAIQKSEREMASGIRPRTRQP